MGMSHKKAWAMVDEMNTRGSKPYVIAQKGGEKGGGTRLTDAGKKMVAAYRKLSDRLFSIIEKDKDILKLV